MQKYLADKNRHSFSNHLDTFRKVNGDEVVMQMLDRMLPASEDTSVVCVILKYLLDSLTIQESVRHHETGWPCYSPKLQDLLTQVITAKKESQPESPERILNDILTIRPGPVAPGSLLASLIPQLGITMGQEELLQRLIANPFDLATLELFLASPLF